VRKLEVLRRRLHDARGGRVVFLSHCLLDPNVRYLGGASRRGALEDAIRPYLDRGVGLCQMPCPERCAWGGVLKRYTVPGYGATGRPLRALRALVLPLFIAYTRLRYRVLARRVAAEIADYLRAGVIVEAIVGVAGSPSCGARVTLDLRRVARHLGEIPLDAIEPDEVNRAVAAARVAGEGWFVAALRRALARRGLEVPLAEHDDAFRPESPRAMRGARGSRSRARRAR
jgi:hypothetical protein